MLKINLFFSIQQICSEPALTNSLGGHCFAKKVHSLFKWYHVSIKAKALQKKSVERIYK